MGGLGFQGAGLSICREAPLGDHGRVARYWRLSNDHRNGQTLAVRPNGNSMVNRSGQLTPSPGWELHPGDWGALTGRPQLLESVAATSGAAGVPVRDRRTRSNPRIEEFVSDRSRERSTREIPAVGMYVGIAQRGIGNASPQVDTQDTDGALIAQDQLCEAVVMDVASRGHRSRVASAQALYKGEEGAIGR